MSSVHFGFVTSPNAKLFLHSRDPLRCSRHRSRGRPCVGIRSLECKSKSKTKTKSKKKTDADPNVLLTESELSEWREISSLIQSLNPKLEEKDADKIVSRAFGWGSQKWWRGEVVNEAPRMGTVQNVLEFLRNEIGFDDYTIGTRVLKKFPEVIRMSLTRMRENKKFLQNTYPVLKNSSTLLASLTEQPQALGFDVDCGGDCQSECSRCWVRFE